jgi:hypothetical protein
MMTMSALDPTPFQSVALIADMVDMVTFSWASCGLKFFLRAQAGVCAPARIGGYHVHHVRPFANGRLFNSLQTDMVRNVTISDHVHHVRPPGKESFLSIIPTRLGALNDVA